MVPISAASVAAHLWLHGIIGFERVWDRITNAC